MRWTLLFVIIAVSVEGKVYEKSYCTFSFCNHAAPPVCELAEGLLTDETIDKAIDWAKAGKGNVYYDCNPPGKPTRIPPPDFRTERGTNDVLRGSAATTDDTLRAK